MVDAYLFRLFCSRLRSVSINTASRLCCRQESFPHRSKVPHSIPEEWLRELMVLLKLCFDMTPANTRSTIERFQSVPNSLLFVREIAVTKPADIGEISEANNRSDGDGEEN